MYGVQDAFGTVLFAVVAGGGVIALICVVGMPALYEQIGKGNFALDGEEAQASARRTGHSGAADARIREEEIRQMLEGRNAIRARRGLRTLDVAEEVARLTAPAQDAGLAAEVRQLVLARNERRMRAGKPALDVEAEVRRRMSELPGG